MLLLVILTALAVSMALTPLLMRLAPQLRMVDVPDPRKVHAVPIPRVGGVGIVVGALVAVALWMEPQTWTGSYLLGSLVLLAFGAADDSMELGHYTKFIGQFFAAIAVVYWGDVWVMHMPFLTSEIPPEVGKPFTVIALVGVMNAINHSDGLDGLAGGESLLSLGCIAYLAYLAGGTAVLVLAAAVGGGVFGFLRFNTHPARVFMGDAGSQFLGFSLGLLAVLLTQQVNTGLSMALPALLIGLPIVDILVVFALRIYHRMNWFRATRNHIHHRLLDIGFRHGQSVVVIYSVQVLLVLSALAASYESDALVAFIYVGVCGLLFAMISAAERRGWRLPKQQAASAGTSAPAKQGIAASLREVPLRFVQVSVPLYVLIAGLRIERVPFDFALVAAGVLALASGSLLLKPVAAKRLLLRIAVYSGVACEVYLLAQSEGVAAGIASSLETAYFVLLGLAVAAAVRMQKGAQAFRTTPLDFLLVVVAITAGVLAERQVADNGVMASMIIRLALLFYACELAINDSRTRKLHVQEWSLIGAAVVLLSKTFAVA
ncbi:MAG: MraY family glycosyltransferase [Betaproteobacteria bacterium]